MQNKTNLLEWNNVCVFKNEKLDVINFIRINTSTKGRKDNIFRKIIRSRYKSFVISKGYEINYKQKENIE